MKNYGRSKELEARVRGGKGLMNGGSYCARIAMEGERQSVSSGYYTQKAEKTLSGYGTGGAWKRKNIKTKTSEDVLVATSKRGVTPLMVAAFVRNDVLMTMLSSCMTSKEIAMVDEDGLSAAEYVRREESGDGGGGTKGSSTSCYVIVVDPMLG